MRSVGSSSSSTTITLYGASSAYAGSSGGCGTTNDQIVPRPDTRLPLARRVDRQRGHIGRGGMRRAPHVAARLHEQLAARAAVPERRRRRRSSRSGSRTSRVSIVASVLP